MLEFLIQIKFRLQYFWIVFFKGLESRVVANERLEISEIHT